jgi:ABC-type Mn2+/Zn2+ transport system ATPase subunit
MQGTITLSNYRCFDETEPATLRIGGGEVIALVGPNNCGKSAFLRFFFEARALLTKLATLNNEVTDAFNGKPQQLAFLEINDPDEVFSNRSKGDMIIEFRVRPDPHEVKPPYTVADRLVVTVSRTTKTWLLRIGADGGQWFQPVSQLTPQLALLLAASRDGKQVDLEPYQKFFSTLAKSMYIGPVRHAVGGGMPYYDIVTGAEVVRRWQGLKSGPNLASTRLALGLEEELERIFGFKSLSIGASTSGNELQVIANKEIYYLHRLGAGLSQFLIVMVNLATVSSPPPLILIDEPELNLHPALQIEFVRMLYSRAPAGVVFATHNIGLARDIADRVYTFQKRPETPATVKEHTPDARLSQVLGEMSFSSLRELGFSRVLLVEGPTEVKVFRHFLGLYGKADKVIVIPLGGSGMINGQRREELQEIIGITANPAEILAIIDSERTSRGGPPKAEHEEFRNVCAGLRIRCHLLDRRATENYFPEPAVQRGMGASYHALGHYDPLEKQKHWRKRYNWRIAQHMTTADLVGTDIDQFIVALV